MFCRRDFLATSALAVITGSILPKLSEHASGRAGGEGVEVDRRQSSLTSDERLLRAKRRASVGQSVPFPSP